MRNKIAVGVLLVLGCAIGDAAFGQTPKQQRTPPADKLEVRGGEVRKVEGTDAGAPMSALPEAKFVTSAEADQVLQRRRADRKTKGRAASGLYLVDTPYVPHGLKEQLASEGFRLLKDGKVLDKHGRPTTLFVSDETYVITRQRTDILDGEPKVRHAERSGSLLGGLLIGEAKAASPHPWTCYSFRTWYWETTNWYLRYHAKTRGIAWGPLDNVPCAQPTVSRPRTNIEYIETRAEIDQVEDHDTCSNCNERVSETVRKGVCRICATGASTQNVVHFLNMADGALNVLRVKTRVVPWP